VNRARRISEERAAAKAQWEDVDKQEEADHEGAVGWNLAAISEDDTEAA
jgi:hypothetical protein